MDKLKIVVGVLIIIASFVYIIRNKNSMLDNLMKKSKEDYEKRQKIKDKAQEVVEGEADAFDTIAEAVKPAVEDIKKRSSR